MASELRVNTLKDSAGNNSVGMSFVAEGTAKAWITHQHGDTTDDSFNQSALTDSGTGDFTCNFSSNMSSASYIVPNCGSTYADQHRGGMSCGMDMGTGTTDNRASDHCDVSVMYHASSTANATMGDVDWSMHIFFGDLA